jgi:hypothetical protein
MLTTTVRQFAKVTNGQIHLILPSGFDYTEVEVIIIPRERDREDLQPWQERELQSVGKIGMSSKSFAEDDEDYAKW